MTETYQHNLDMVSSAFWTRQFGRMLDHLCIPGQIVTTESEMVMTNKDELFVLAADYRDRLIALGVRSYHRVCLRADYAPRCEDMILGQHETYLLGDDATKIDSFSSHMTLMHVDGKWKGIRIGNLASNKRFCFFGDDFAQDQRTAFAALSKDRAV
ncbi:MAG: hypothetical protein GDA40_05780 [Rhodobacteraceae bacterium]|nr:hypothetical protein [Paracoccaceae bacterium]